MSRGVQAPSDDGLVASHTAPRRGARTDRRVGACPNSHRPTHHTLSPRPLGSFFSSKGFSLIELLAAVSVMSILGLLVTQITLGVASGAKSSMQPVDSYAQARLVFDRLAMDLRNMPIRNDLEYQFGATPASDNVLLFFSLTGSNPDPGRPSNENRGAGIIAYRIGLDYPKESESRPALLRGSKAVYWSGNMSKDHMGLEQLSANAPWTPALLPVVNGTGTSSYPNGDYDVLAAGVFHTDLCFILREDYTNPATGVTSKAGALLASAPVKRLNGIDYTDPSKIRAIVLGVAVIDLETRKLATASQLKALATEFPPMEDGRTPLETWSVLRTLNFTTNVVPPVRASIRGYQRILELP